MGFDQLAEAHGIYKVETVGDSYIAGQTDNGLLSTHHSIAALLRFSIGMITETSTWSAEMGLNVKCRVGLHTGTAIGGIVGCEMQRYRLFGAIMAGVEKLESTAPEAN